MATQKTIIGRAEKVRLSISPDQLVTAKIDTGADVSSVWASDVSETGDGLVFCLFGEGNACYSGEQITMPKGSYRSSMIASSFGTREQRYVVCLQVEVLGRSLKAEFTLANRSTKIYPMLLGRGLLEQDFLVDVTKGEPLVDAERNKKVTLHVDLSE